MSDEENPRYTKEGLPIVTLDAIRDIASDMDNEGEEEWVLERTERLDKDNRGVSTYMVKVIEQCPPEQGANLLMAMTGVYEILVKQQELYAKTPMFNRSLLH